MPSVRFDLDYGGIVDLLTSDGVAAMLRDKADAVANAARSRGVLVDGHPGDVPMPVQVVDASSSSRARMLVVADHASALAVESKHRLLVGSLDAARRA